MHSLRLGIRHIFQNGTLSAAIIAIIAMALGSTATVLSFAQAVLLHPLPYKHPERIVAIHETTARSPRGNFSAEGYVSLQNSTQALEQVGALK